MMQTILRWVIPLFGLLMIGPVAGLCTSHLHLADGSGSATLLVSTTPLKGLVLGAAAVLLATIVGVIGGRLINELYGYFSAGLTLAWAAWGTGNIDQLVRSYQSGSILPRLAIEGAIVGAMGVGAAWLIHSTARRAPHAAPDAPGEGTAWGERAKAFGACLVVAGVVAWFMAPESLKGQTFAAAAFAGLLGALASKLTLRSVTPTVIFGVVALLAIAGPATAAFMYGTGSAIVRPAYDGSLMPLARILPLDWVAGALVGVPIGLSWGASMTEAAHH